MTISAVTRCLSLLELLANQSEPIELSDIAERLDLPASAAHRLVTTLVSQGWVHQDPSSHKYALSLRMSMLAFRNLDGRNLPHTVQAILQKLATETHEYCRLAILEGQNLIWIARAQGALTGLRYDPDMGEDIVLHATANGKAWLSTLPEEEALATVYSRGFNTGQKVGPNCVRSIDELRAQLSETRKRGFATSVEEAELGTGAVAVTFRSGPESDAPVAGTISVAGPIVRITPARWPELVEALQRAAGELARVWPMRSRQRGSSRLPPSMME